MFIHRYEWIQKMYIYAVEYCSAIKENEVMPFAATWIDVEIVILSEVVIQRKEKYHVRSPLRES